MTNRRLDLPISLLFVSLVLSASPALTQNATGPAEEPGETESPSEEPTRVLAEIDVSASYSFNRDEPISAVALTREEILRLPHFGDDLFRALPVLPSVTGNDISAQFNVRGGLYRDTAQLLDGVEIFEPYHLKDFQGVFSVVDPRTIGSVELLPGGFPAEYGDKSAGVLDLRTAQPGAGLTGNLGISLSNAWASGSGSFGRDDASRWFASGRRGYLDLLLDVSGARDDEEECEGAGPEYWDLIARVDRALTPSQTLSLSVLAAEDSLEEREVENDDFGLPEREEVDSDYGNSYLWLDHQGLLGTRAFVDTVLSVGRVDRDRFSSEESFASAFEIQDIRDMEVLALRQDWNAQLSDRHYLKWGFEARTYDVDYDYTNDLAFRGPLGSDGLTRFTDSFSSESYALYIADRAQLTRSLVLELGARYDRQTLLDEDQWSPRLNLVYDLGGAGVLRGAWGRYSQSQRPNELQVEDGETEFQPAETAETVQLGWERPFGSYSVRVDAYHRRTGDPRPYYTNLFEAFDPNPEATRDRVRIAADSSTAQGVELFVRRRTGRKLDWWGSYTWSETTDRLDGRDVPRSFDQTHALTLGLNYRVGRKWNVNFVWNWHTGWPTTAISAVAVEGPDGELAIEPVLGPLNGERVDDYHRLDVRASRTMQLRGGNTLEFFIDVQNLYNRENVAGFSVDERNFELLPSGEVVYTPTEENWLGLLPSFGVSWKF